MKKILWVLIGIIFIAGCTKLETKPEEVDPEPVVIEFWYGLTGNQGKAMETFIDSFNQSQDEVFVKGVSQESYQVTSKALKSSIVKKSVPDVVLLEDSNMFEMANKGVLKDLSPFIDQRPGFREDFVSSFFEQNVMDDKIYALPIYGTTQVLYYRKDMFEQAGIDLDLLNTWEGLAEAARILTKRDDQGETIVYGFALMQGRENIIDSSINRGGRFISGDGHTMVLNSPAWNHTLENFRAWIHDEKIMKVNYGGEGWQYWYATIDDVMQGKAAGYFGSAADYKDLDFDMIGVHLRPYWEGYERNATGYLNAHTICIPEMVDDEKAQAAFLWMAYMTSPEISAAWSMETGYIPVRESSFTLPEYEAFVGEINGFQIINEQRKFSTHLLQDPTGGEIYEGIKNISVDVEVFNKPVEDNLNDLNQKLQEILDGIQKDDNQ